ncbi:MAG: ExbD/TolR family protein [Phycisphaerales bacterium]
MSARRARRYRRRGAFGPNMTPMVDVVLVILIFFMGAMGLAAAEQYLGTGAPPADASEQGRSAASSDSTPAPANATPASRAILRMTVQSGRTVVNGMGLANVSIAEIADRLDTLVKAGFDASVIVVVAPARDVPYQDVVLVHDAAGRAGITNIRLGVSSEATR